MLVTFNITNYDVKYAFEEYLDDNLFQEFGPGVLKKAGVPSKKKIMEEALADPVFMNKLQKAADDYLKNDTDGISMMLFCLDRVAIPNLSKHIAKASKVHNETEKDLIQASIDKKVKQAVDLLRSRGFTVAR